MKQKANIYFEGFVEGMDRACEASAFMLELCKNYVPVELESKVLDLHKIEHAGDLVKHRLMEKLAKEFITPIEREDILEMLQQIDNVIDSIEDVGRKMYMYNIQSIRKEMLEFLEIINQSCIVTRDAVRELPNFHKPDALRELIIRVNELEESGDKMHSSSTRRLYTENVSPLERSAWTKMFDCLEDCCDSCEHVTDTLEMIILKNT